MLTGGPKINNDGLILALDAGNSKSFSVNNWIDLSNSNSIGELKNGAQFNNGVISLDGTNDYISFNSNPLYRLLNNMTFSFVFKWVASGNGVTLVTRGAQSKLGFYWIMIYNGKPYFQFRKDNNSGYFGLQSPISLLENTWYHWDIVIDVDEVTMYINGEQLAYWNVLTNYGFSIGRTDFDNEMRIGSYASDYSTWFYSGNILSFLIYNRSLSSSDILSNYNTQKLRFKQ